MIHVNTIKITLEILSLIAELDEFKGAWQALGVLEPERLNALRHVATIESIGSSTRIEGSKLSDKAVAHLLENININTFESRDEQEVAGYANVMAMIYESWSEMPVTENIIKQLHRDLLNYSKKDNRHRGDYKKFSNHVVAFDASGKQVGIVFETATPLKTPRLMTELISWYQEAVKTTRLHPLLIIGISIVVFLAIHPFQDGNGRLSRILTMLLLLKAGYVYVPYSSLESMIENSKEGYYKALRQTQKTICNEKPNWQPWLIFFLSTLQKQKQHLSIKMEREKLLAGRLSVLSLQIIHYVREHGRITIGDMVRVTGANRNTLKEHLKNLVEKKVLILHGRGKGAWYALY